MKYLWTILTAAVMLAATATVAAGQTQTQQPYLANLPDAPEPHPSIEHVSLVSVFFGPPKSAASGSGSSPSGFWTKTQIAQSLVFAGLVTYDGASTQYLRGQGFTELDPLAKPFVNRGAAGQVAACAIGWGTLTGTQWLLDHFGHHNRIAAAIGYAAMGLEGVNDGRQYGLVRGAEGNKF